MPCVEPEIEREKHTGTICDGKKLLAPKEAFISSLKVREQK